MTSARDLAQRYDQFVSALWRGESVDVLRFGAWLQTYWAIGDPDEPSGAPAAVSALGGAGASIRWYEVDDAILGFIPGVVHRRYRVPTAAAPPPIPPVER